MNTDVSEKTDTHRFEKVMWRTFLTDSFCFPVVPASGFGNVEKNPLDKIYLEHLFSLVRKAFGDDLIIWTTDGDVKLTAGGLRNQTLMTPDL
jgi:hypothetical protein